MTDEPSPQTPIPEPVPTPTPEVPAEQPVTPTPEPTPVPEVPAEPKTEEVPMVQEAEIVEKKEEEKEEPKEFTIRSDETGDKVYLVREGKRYWIKNPETLIKLGFYLGKEKRLPFSELLRYPEGNPVDTTVPNPVMPWDQPNVPPQPIANQPHKIWS